MAKHVEIRPALPSDEDAIRDCAERAYAQYIEAIGKRPAPMVADFASLIASGHAHVAVDQHGRVVGFIVFFRKGESVLLENVAVRPDAAGMGIGKRLIRFCEAEAKRTGAASVKLYTNEKMAGNLSLYPRLGYRQTDRKTQDGFNRVFFEKPV